MEKALKYAKGTIWNVDDFLNQAEQGVQSGRRPCVIISSDQGNSSNDAVIVAMITSKPKTNVAINVPFINIKGEENVVLCNQLHTVSKKWLKDPMLGILNSETMKKVDKALAISLGMTIVNQTGINLDTEFIQRLLLNITRNNVITVEDQKKEKEAEEHKAVHVEHKVTPVAEAPIKALIAAPSVKKPVKVKESTSNKALDGDVQKIRKTRSTKKSQAIVNELLGNKSEEKANTSDKIKTVSVEKGTEKYKKKGTWNNDTKLQYIVDVDSNGYEVAMEKWNMKSRATAMSYYCKFKKELDIKTERQKRKRS